LACAPSKRPVLRQQRRKAAARAARARVVPAELLEQLRVDADDAVATLDAGLARGNPRRRLLEGSKGSLGVLIAVHDILPLAKCRRIIASTSRLPRTVSYGARYAADEDVGPMSPRRVKFNYLVAQ